MNVAVGYQFHDYSPQTFVLDTNRLNEEHLFERDLKAKLERGTGHHVMNGDLYNDDWGDLDNAKINTPCEIQAICILEVSFDS